MRCVTHAHQPMTYSAIHGPKTPGARVMTTRGGSSRTIAQSTPAPMAWSHLSRAAFAKRSEEHTSELQSRPHLVCRLLLEKKKSVWEEGLRLVNHCGGGIKT